ncbi:hypothetical protein MAUB1S_03678 [Mycolicibacterium aubagnense]
MKHTAAPLGVGIVGLSADGGWAARGHLPALRAVEGYELRALMVSTPDSARKAAAAFGLPESAAGTDAAALAARDDVDLVVITVRVPRHRELILPVLEAGEDGAQRVAPGQRPGRGRGTRGAGGRDGHADGGGPAGRFRPRGPLPPGPRRGRLRR